jgi:hypothetical protein
MLHCAKKPRGNIGPTRDSAKFRVINGTKPRGPGRDGKQEGDCQCLTSIVATARCRHS